VEPLNTLDIFAGCGGLSEGLHQSGVAVTKWAIECDPLAAQAFRINNPEASVFSDDCNGILKLAIDGEKSTVTGQLLPPKDQVCIISFSSSNQCRVQSDLDSECITRQVFIID